MELESASKTRLSREPLKHVAACHFRKQLKLSVPQYRSGEWKYLFKMSSFTTTILNLLFAEVEQKGKARKYFLHTLDLGLMVRVQISCLST